MVQTHKYLRDMDIRELTGIERVLNKIHSDMNKCALQGGSYFLCYEQHMKPWFVALDETIEKELDEMQKARLLKIGFVKAVR